MVDDFKHYDASIGGEYGLVKYLEDNNYPDRPRWEPMYSVSDPDTFFEALVIYHAKREKHKHQPKNISRGRVLEMMILKKVVRLQIEGLWTDIHNQYSRGL